MTEADIQREVFNELKSRHMPGCLFWHVPNDKASRRKSGYKAGVSDVHILHRGHLFCMELKKDGGRPTEEQMEFVSGVNAAGGYACIASGLPQAIKILETWGVVRGRAA